ncbi:MULTISPECIES: FAD/NAD(P)-binding protein [Pseudofrankia]|uniref:FAD/NAD(P)-binding protein n=1 Tax=Pseudofrankia TaxID=2994363 RepID=UPI000234D7BB|nr:MULTISPECIES: FAD/NAD(P)-binding protein [Pseudofrankia]OHV32295.1 oxidoreductase [Pseudofrankia sp. EUN1h]
MSTETQSRADRSGAGAMTPRPFRVIQRHQETHDTWTLYLAPAVGTEPLLRHRAGQFTMVYAFGVGEVPLSLAGGAGSSGGACPTTGTAPALEPAPPRTEPAADGRTLVHTVRAVGPVTEAICASRPGDVLGVRGPFGRGWPLDPDRLAGADLVLVAGGLGLAPLRPAVEYVLSRRQEYGDVALLVGGRTPLDLLYHDELAAWARGGDIQVLVTVDAADAGWTGDVGVVTALLPRTRFDPARTVAFTCGPEIMMRLTAQALVERGVRASAVHLSMERNMHCGVGHCGRCQLGPLMLCQDGPVADFGRLGPLLSVREL